MIARPTEWWWAPEYDKTPPMNYPDHRPRSKVVKLPDDTDPVMFRASNGQLRLRLDPVDPPRPDLVIYTERTPWSTRRH